MDKLALAPGQYMTLNASSLSVGLPTGLMGNSEVGHLNIGAGRVVYQDIVRITLDVDNNTLIKNQYFVEACEKAKSNTGRLHFLGLISDGGVHSHIDHLEALLQSAQQIGVPQAFVHFFGDGRDTKPTSTVIYAEKLLTFLKSTNYGSLATVVGRYYAMDRDKRWERVKVAFDAITQGIGEACEPDNLIQLIRSRYDAMDEKRQTDEFLTPIIVDSQGMVKDSDVLIFFNFRSDRMRQLSECMGIKCRFKTDYVPKDLSIYTMTQYKKDFPFKNLYPPVVPKNVLAEWISKKNLSQFHCAETEKYAHVTFFFNGGQEQAFPLEDRQMVPSPKVPTYDQLPEMNSLGVAEEMAKAIQSRKYPFVMCNFAPPDMVGHTGVYEAAIKGVEATDMGIGIILKACEDSDCVLLVTADHGNAEVMKDESGNPVTSHTTNRVPFCMTGSRKFITPTHDAALCDVAPTVLELMALDIPPDMTGRSLLLK